LNDAETLLLVVAWYNEKLPKPEKLAKTYRKGLLTIRTFIKPELQVLEIRLEERIAACDRDSVDLGEWALNGNNPNRNRPPDGSNNCWIWVPNLSYSANES